jgi:hypothetical protein
MKVPPKWSLDQALIWIASRDIERVFAGESWALFTLNVDDDDEFERLVVPPAEARDLLKWALQDGSVVAEGTQTGPVPAHWFNAVELKPSVDGVKAFNPTDPWAEPDAIARPYDDRARTLYILSAGLMKAFPETDTPQEPEKAAQRHSRTMKGGAKARGIAEAARSLFPDGVPIGLSIKERDRQIVDWLWANDYSLPDPRTIRRFFNQ